MSGWQGFAAQCLNITEHYRVGAFISRVQRPEQRRRLVGHGATFTIHCARSTASDWEIFKNFFGSESEAARILSYEPDAIPGLLQTGNYAKRVLGQSRSGVSHTKLTVPPSYEGPPVPAHWR
jgi:hypothetical protein